MNRVVSPQDVTGSNKSCQYYFVFDYISALPVSRSKFYQQACALSDYQAAIIQHACHILFPLHLPQQTVRYCGAKHLFCGLSFVLHRFYCFRAFVSFVQSNLSHVCFINFVQIKQKNIDRQKNIDILKTCVYVNQLTN